MVLLQAELHFVGAAGDARELLQADYRVVSPQYFKTVGMALLSGRAFTNADDARAPDVAGP